MFRGDFLFFGITGLQEKHKKQEAVQETMLHQWFYKKCKVLIFSVYFCGANIKLYFIYK